MSESKCHFCENNKQFGLTLNDKWIEIDKTHFVFSSHGMVAKEIDIIEIVSYINSVFPNMVELCFDEDNSHFHFWVKEL